MEGSVSSPRRRPVVLVLLGCFWPGNDSSGPNQSFKALATALGDEFEFRLVARDRPTGPGQAAPARRDDWTDLGFAAREPFQNADHYRRYLAMLADIPRYFDEQIANMRAELLE